MSPVDAVMWRGDHDRRLRSTMSMLEIYDRTPDSDRLVAALEWGTRMVPRLRQRVVDSPFGTGTPSWSVDPDFDLHYHLRRLRLPGPGSMADLLECCEQLAMTPLDPARPPWECYVIEGLPDGRAACFFKVHHALTDGVGAIVVLAQLHSRTREPLPAKPQPPAPVPENTSALDILRRQLAHEIARVPHRVDIALGAARALARPRRALSDVMRYGRSVPRVAGLVSPPGSPVLARRSLSWRFLAFEVPLAGLQAVATEVRASINDVYLGGLISGFRAYHEALGVTVEAIPVAVPLSVRDPADRQGGNRIAVGRLAGPVGIADPFERVLTVREQVRAARAEPAVDVFTEIGPILAWLPGELLSRVSGATSRNDLQAGNIPGIPWETYIAGAKVERMFPFGPLPGCAVMATMISHTGTACLGLNVDAAAVIDIDLFADSVVAGFDEVLGLAGKAVRLTRVG
ncbi:MAG: wax ester/triacylglycerol synthase family O-acyltransferase [Gordonia sp. (in: high G+C Gram-positive bacteria)]